MTYRGHVQNGVVVFDEPTPLPDGVRVHIEPAETEEEFPPLSERLKDAIGIIDDLPPDMAEQHDHYIHGRPKK